MCRLSRDNLFAGGLSSIFSLTFKSQEQVKEAKLKQLGGEETTFERIDRSFGPIAARGPRRLEKDPKREKVKNPRDRHALQAKVRQGNSELLEKCEVIFCTEESWQYLWQYSAQKNRDNRCTQTQWRYTEWTRPATRSSRRGFSQSPGSWFFDSGHQRLWRRKKCECFDLIIIKFHLAREPESRESLSLQAFANSTCGVCFTFGFGEI